MYCSQCGVALVNGKCPVCGKSNIKTVPQSNSLQTNCLNSGVDGSRTGFNILSFLWPFVGMVFYCVWMDFFPVRAKSCSKWALIRIVVNIGLLLLAYALRESASTIISKIFNSYI